MKLGVYSLVSTLNWQLAGKTDGITHHLSILSIFVKTPPMRHKPKNATFFVDKDRRAELFFQAVNMDHFVDRYVADLSKDETTRSHHLKPSEINKVLQSGDVLIEPINDSATHHYAIAFWKGRYYYANFYLDNRADCNQLFAILITCYATTNKNVQDRYQEWLKTHPFRLG